MLVQVFVLCVEAAAVILILTQVVWPIIMGTPLFPAFRKKLREATDGLDAAEVARRVAEVNKETAEVEQAAQRLRDAVAKKQGKL